MTVAEIGAGYGRLAVRVARHLGPSGRLFATEIEAEKRNAIQSAATAAGLANIAVIQAGQHSTRLPDDCCDLIFMRRVYHHLDDAINKSLYSSLRPGGRLVIIDFLSPRWMFFLRHVNRVRLRGCRIGRRLHARRSNMPFVTPLTPAGVQLRSILVATDFSPASDKPLRHAVAIARHYGANFFLMHVVSSLGFNLVGPDAIAQATELAWRDAREAEDKLVASGVLAGLHHQVIICDGDIWLTVERVIEEQSIDMVVIGTHSRKGLAKLVLGSVAEQIFRHASCLVLTVGPNSPADAEIEPTGIVRPLLFATDFGEGSGRALPYAISFANQRRTKLVLIHMLSPSLKAEGRYRGGPGDVDRMRMDELSAARSRLRQSAEHGAASGVESELIVEFGEAAEGILRTAESLKAEAIIMGLHRKAHIEMVSHLPRSTAYQVACRAVCPVLTVRS